MLLRASSIVLGPLTSVAGSAGLSVCVIIVGWRDAPVSGLVELGVSVLDSEATSVITLSADLLKGSSLAGLHSPLDFLTRPSVDFIGDLNPTCDSQKTST